MIDFGLWIVDCGLWIVDCGLWIEGFEKVRGTGRRPVFLKQNHGPGPGAPGCHESFKALDWDCGFGSYLAGVD
jgi:hypothetical protein